MRIGLASVSCVAVALGAALAAGPAAADPWQYGPSGPDHALHVRSEALNRLYGLGGPHPLGPLRLARTARHLDLCSPDACGPRADAPVDLRSPDARAAGRRR